MTTVVNQSKSLYDVYIGRGSIFGNPYEIGIDGTRAEVLERYKKWFDFMIRDAIFLRELDQLEGKVLGCFCKPELCHGDIIAGFLNEREWNKILK
jgi:hypothetical protein